jgi:DNA-3-methyladenine glycosylase
LQRLDKEYYTLDAVSLAQRLIGKLLCRKIDDKVIKKRITETEAYLGESDTACHAHKGKDKKDKCYVQARRSELHISLLWNV